MWDLKSIILFMCSMLIVILISVKSAEAGEKTKEEWNALYTEAGCMD